MRTCLGRGTASALATAVLRLSALVIFSVLAACSADSKSTSIDAPSSPIDGAVASQADAPIAHADAPAVHVDAPAPPHADAPAGGGADAPSITHFSTLPPGSALPDDATCAGLVRHAPENKGVN